MHKQGIFSHKTAVINSLILMLTYPIIQMSTCSLIVKETIPITPNFLIKYGQSGTFLLPYVPVSYICF